MLLQVVAVVFGAVLAQGYGIVPGPVIYGGDPRSMQEKDANITCNGPMFDRCELLFFQQLNFTVPTSAADLAHQVGNLLESQGVDGFNALCGAMEDFVFCLGGGNDAAVAACFNVPYLTSHGLNMTEAIGEVGLYLALRFQCGAGYQVMLNNYQCIMTVSAQMAPQMQKCQDSFVTNMQNSPNDKCNNLGMLLDCDSLLYAPCSQQTVWQQCTTMTSSLFLQFPECAANVTCTGTGAMYPSKSTMSTTTAAPTTFLFTATIDDAGRPWNPAYGDFSSPTAQSLAFLYSREIYQTVQSVFPTATIQVTAFSRVLTYTRLVSTIRIHLLGEQTTIPTAAAVQAAIIAGAAQMHYQWTPSVQPQAPPTPPPQVGTSQGWEDAAAMYAQSIDVTADPCQDFFKFSCGQWIANHPLPAHASSVSNFGQMYNDLLSQVATQLDNYQDDGSVYSLSQAKIFWNICLQSGNMPLSGQAVLTMLLEMGNWPMIQPNWADSQMMEIGQLMGMLVSKYGLNTFVSPGVDTDWKNPTSWLLYLDQATLFYPTVYYQNSQISSAAIQNEGNYAFGLAKQLASINNQLNGVPIPPDAQIQKDVNDMLQLEYSIAMKLTSDDNRRLQERMYNKFTMPQASARWSFMNWNSYLTGVASNYVSSPSVITQSTFGVTELVFMDNLNSMLSQYPKRVLQNYFMFRLVDTQASFLPDLKAEYLKFKHVTEGVTALPPIEYTCADSLINYMPYIGGRLYIDSHFKHLRGDPRGGLATMTLEVQNQFRLMLQNLPWMDDATKQAAYNKLSNYVRNYAFPDWIMDNAALDAVHPTAFFNLSPQDNIQVVNTKLIQYTNWYNYRMLQPGFPVDRTMFVATPATINAFYAPEFNSITILAGIMNPPFFRADFPQSVNFGGLGLVIGHETTHGFDDEGVQWDGVGNLTNWIDSQSAQGFTNMAKCVIDEYSSFCYPNITPSCINGVQTQGENIADNGGIRAAYYGYKAQIAQRGAEPVLPGAMSEFTMDQIFFIAFAQGWCENATPQRISRQLLIDPHSPGEWRVKGSVRNMQEFADAFNCPAGSFEAPVNRCNVWH